jgi:hypothetical protein
MQVFIPFRSVRKSLRYLARYPKRLLAQLREGTDALRAIKGRPVVRSHPNHTVTRSWKANEEFLRYYVCRCSDAIRKYTKRKSDGQPYKTQTFDELIRTELGGWVDSAKGVAKPEWWGNKDIHESYRAQLYRKNPDLYPKWKCYADKYPDYVWPVPKLSKRPSGLAKKITKASTNVLVS